MTALAPTERAKLARVQGMLGSDHAGERDAAAIAASKLLARNRANWDDVLAPPADESRPQAAPLPEHGWRVELSFCRLHVSRCTEWERGFVTSIAQRRSGPTPGQATKLRQIADDLRKRGAS